MAKTPLISVVIPAFQVADYAGEALDSVMAQTCQDFEVIVINDGSSDTPALRAALEPYRHRILYLEQPQRGISAARNNGIEHARGEFLAFLDADDVWLPHCLETQLQLLGDGRSLDMVWADLEYFGEGPDAGRTVMEISPNERPVTLERIIRLRSTPLTSAVVVRKQCVLDAGMFDRAFNRSEDYDLWLRLALRGTRMDYQTKAVGKRRIRSTSASFDDVALLRSGVAVLRKFSKLPGVGEEIRHAIEAQERAATAWADRDEGRHCLLNGDYARAAVLLRNANEFYRSPKIQWMLRGLRAAPGLTARAVKLWNSRN